MSIKATSLTSGPVTAGYEQKPYVYNGDQPLKRDESGRPDLPQNAKASLEKRERFAEYTRLRLAKVPKKEAAERVGIKPGTGAYYERDFRDEHPEACDG